MNVKVMFILVAVLAITSFFKEEGIFYDITCSSALTPITTINSIHKKYYSPDAYHGQVYD